jgi:Mg-chelatase subunit ChlD
VVAVTTALLGLPAAQASAEPTPVTTDEVVRALALSPQATDFVVLLDTSSSMAKGKRPDFVRAELSALLKIMEPTDRLALFTFDSVVTSRYRGLAGDQTAKLLDSLPEANGRWSDQGAALDAGVAELARAGANPQAVVVVITDGRPDAGPRSDFQSEQGKAWADLIENGNRLAGQRPIVSYQITLSSDAKPHLHGQVFPGTRTVKPSSAVRQIASIKSDLDRLRAAGELSAELEAPITVGWSGDFASGSAGWLPIQISVTSGFSHVPVVLSKLSVASTGGVSAEVSGLPATVELDPGQTKELDAQIQLNGDGNLRDLRLSVDAAVDSPWRPALTAALGLEFEPKLVTVVGLSRPGALERSVPTLVTVGGLLGLSVLVWWLGFALVSPRMRGELIFSRHAQEVARVELRGRRQFVTGTPGTGALAALAGTVYGARPIRGSEREVRVDLAAGKNWSRGVIQDGHVIQMGDMEIAYSSELGAILRPAAAH